MIHEKAAKATLALVFYISSAFPAVPFSQNPFLRRDFFDLPTRETALSLSKKYQLIPLCKRVLADTETPIRLYARVKDQPYSFLLESVEESEHRSRYSFIGYDPFLTVKGKGTEITTTKRNGESQKTVGLPYPVCFFTIHA